MIDIGKPVRTYVFNRRSVYFGEKKWSRGVTTVIKKIFASSYTYKKLRMKHVCAKGLKKNHAKRRGMLVDSIIEKWVSGQTIKCRIYEPRMLIRKFESMSWIPVASQLVVAYETARLATKIDLILYDELENILRIIEVKTGYHYRRCSTKNGTLMHIRPVVDNSPLHQHQLQALIGKWLFLKTYPQWENKSVESVVVYVSTEGQIEMITEQDFQVKFSTIVENVLIRTA